MQSEEGVVLKEDFSRKDIYIKRVDEKEFRVEGRLVEEALEKTDLNNEDSLQRMLRILKHHGLNKLMEEKGVKNGDTVVIGPLEYDYVE